MVGKTGTRALGTIMSKSPKDKSQQTSRAQEDLLPGMIEKPRSPSAATIGNWAGDEEPEQEFYRDRLLPKKTFQLAVSGQVQVSEIER